MGTAEIGDCRLDSTTEGVDAGHYNTEILDGGSVLQRGGGNVHGVTSFPPILPHLSLVEVNRLEEVVFGDTKRTTSLQEIGYVLHLLEGHLGSLHLTDRTWLYAVY